MSGIRVSCYDESAMRQHIYWKLLKTAPVVLRRGENVGLAICPRSRLFRDLVRRLPVRVDPGLRSHESRTPHVPGVGCHRLRRYSFLSVRLPQPTTARSSAAAFRTTSTSNGMRLSPLTSAVNSLRANPQPPLGTGFLSLKQSTTMYFIPQQRTPARLSTN